jgi:2,4-diketo-3-deoxy-L-fuconate hydrolase
MKLFRHGPVGSEKPGVITPRGLLDVSAFGEDYGESFFGTNGPERLRSWLGEHEAACSRIAAHSRTACPIMRPSKIVCIGLNYHAHARETGAAPPSEPVVFMKATTALSGPHDPVELPRASTKTDWEVELAVVIGKPAKYVTHDDALQHVAGYTVHNDFSEREFQLERGGQWDKGKGFDTFAPMGPCLVTPDEISQLTELGLWCSVNGQPMQRGKVGDMIFDVAKLVSYVSHCMTLLAGDVISTGTPKGVGMGKKPPLYLKAGDVVECGIDAIGQLRQRVVATS